jgi:3-methylcrotonyl-CoA carboxylase beta subunit
MTETLKLDNEVGTAVENDAPRARINREALMQLMAEMRDQERVIREGGGAKAADAQRAKGRLTVRERLKLLLDEGTELFELGLWAAYEMYSEYGGAPGSGVSADGCA